MPDDAAKGGRGAGAGLDRVRLIERKQLGAQPGFLRLTSYTMRYAWPPPTEGKAPQWIEQPVTLVDVYRRDAVAGLLHLVRDDPGGGAPEQALFFVRQFRFSTIIDPENGEPDLTRDGYFLELMAGVREAGEPPINTFRRETREETGFDLERIEFIGSFYPSPGACSERIFLYYGRLKLDRRIEEIIEWGVNNQERIERVPMTPQAFLDYVASGQCADAKALAAAEWMRRPGVWERYFAPAPRAPS